MKRQNIKRKRETRWKKGSENPAYMWKKGEGKNERRIQIKNNSKENEKKKRKIEEVNESKTEKSERKNDKEIKMWK